MWNEIKQDVERITGLGMPNGFSDQQFTYRRTRSGVRNNVIRATGAYISYIFINEVAKKV